MKILESSSVRWSTLLAVFGTTVILTAAASWWIQRKKGPQGKWRRVGDLSSLWCYPIKSCGVIQLLEADCVVLGVKSGLLRDRVFMVTGLEGSFKTARTFPHMTQIAPFMEGEDLVLKAPGMQSISLSVKNLSSKEIINASVWDQSVPVVDCGDEVALWLSRFILQEEQGCRLVYYPLDVCTRDVRPNNTFSKMQPKDTGALPDASSFMIVNEASVDDLNLKLPAETPLSTSLHFRPNFLVRGAGLKPYEEDFWKWVRIGERAVFECVKPCTRCVLTTIDPKTGIMAKNMEPLKTLKKYRQITDPEVLKFTGDSPVLGVHLAMHTTGKVRIGDPIYVME